MRTLCGGWIKLCVGRASEGDQSGNMTLWLKSRGLYDRKSTESSNVTPPAAFTFRFRSVLLHGTPVNSLVIGSRIERGKRERDEKCGTLSSRSSDEAELPLSFSGLCAQISSFIEDAIPNIV
jgi:hypothetical protein